MMELLDFYKMDGLAATLLDASAMILVMAPVIYLLFVRPIMRDLSEKKTLSSYLNRLYLTVSACNQALVHATDRELLMNSICRILTEIGGYRMAWIGIAGDDEAKTVRQAALSGHNAGYVESLNLTWADAEYGRGPIGIAIRTNSPVVCRNTSTDPSFKNWREDAMKHGFASMAAVPLSNGNAVFGSLNIYSGNSGAFDEEELRLFTELAADVSFGMHHLEMERSLETSRKRLEEILSLAEEGIYMLDAEGRLVFMNSAAERILGWKENELLGKRLHETIHQSPEGKAEHTPEDCPVLKTIISGLPYRSEDDIFWSKDGRSLSVKIVTTPVIRKGKPAGAVAAFEDITERKLAEAERQKANQELKTAIVTLEKTNAVLLRQEKLASIGTLSAGVAHEILNPLNIISTIVQLMQLDVWPEEVREKLAEIMTQVRRATKITNNLRMFAHVHKYEITAVDVQALFDKTASLIEHDLNLDNIRVQRDYAPDLPPVEADSDLLAQVYLNLINNARHALQEMPKEKDKTIAIATKRRDAYVEICLFDNGPRIPDEIIGKIFDPFFTTKDPDKGTGLGLSMAYTFIQEFGGTIAAQNEDPEGVTFIITLPVVGSNGGNDEYPDGRR